MRHDRIERRTARAVRLAAQGLLLGACAHPAAVRSTVPAGYTSRVAFELSSPTDRLAGRIELLEDARIRPSMREPIRQAWGSDPCADHPSAALRSLCAGPGSPALLPALLRLVDGTGHTIATREAERPLADLSVAQLYGTPRRTYLFTVDLSAGMGSYSGPYTRLAEPTSAGFGWVLARTARDSGLDTLTLVSTLKSAWRAAPRADGHGEDLLMVLCRPDFDAPDSAAARFTVTFERFHFERGEWLAARRSEPGFWEDEGTFPDRARFP